MSVSPQVLHELDEAIKNSLQGLRDSYFSRLLVCTWIVVIGVVLEEAECVLSWPRALRILPLRIVVPKYRLESWARRISRVGWLLIILGVAGEGAYEAFVSRADGFLQEYNSTLLAAAQRQASDAIHEAGGANERAAANEKEAASLRMEAAKIQERLAPRILSDPDRIEIAERLRPFAPGFSTRKVTLSSYTLDAEGIIFSMMIMDILTRAGIEVEPKIGRALPIGMVNPGVKITGPLTDQAFVRSLINGIHAHLDTSMRVELGSKHTEPHIEVGVKPGPWILVPPPSM